MRMTGSNVSMSELHVFDNYAETILTADVARCAYRARGASSTTSKSLSRSRRSRFSVSPVSADGVTFAPVQLVFSGTVNLPFSRGYVQLVTHNHASLKYSEASSGFRQGFTDLDAWIARWDNVGFDGPVLGGTREYEVPDSLLSATSRS